MDFVHAVRSRSYKILTRCDGAFDARYLAKSKPSNWAGDKGGETVHSVKQRTRTPAHELVTIQARIIVSETANECPEVCGCAFQC